MHMQTTFRQHLTFRGSWEARSRSLSERTSGSSKRRSQVSSTWDQASRLMARSSTSSSRMGDIQDRRNDGHSPPHTWSHGSMCLLLHWRHRVYRRHSFHARLRHCALRLPGRLLKSAFTSRSRRSSPYQQTHESLSATTTCLRTQDALSSRGRRQSVSSVGRMCTLGEARLRATLSRCDPRFNSTLRIRVVGRCCRFLDLAAYCRCIGHRAWLL